MNALISTLEQAVAEGKLLPASLENIQLLMRGTQDPVVPATIGSMGGVKIDLDTHVLNQDGAAIPGLYAAGAVANGDFFYQTYPASGTSIQFCFTTGRIAGQQAAAFQP